MGKEPENWTEEELQRFFARLQSEGGSDENVAILKRLLESGLQRGKRFLPLVHKMN